MQIEDKKNIWERKKFLDLWSIPHFLFGILFAFLPEIFGFSVIGTFLTMLVLALLWEVSEKFVEIRETVWNGLIDIILPMAAFFLTREIIKNFEVSREKVIVFFLAILLVYFFTNISGWLAFRRRRREFMH